jgi:Phage integrase family
MAMRLRTLVNKFLAWCEKARKPKTVEHYRRILLQFLKHTKNIPIDKLLPYHLEIWGTTWHKVQAVQRLMQWAMDSIRVVTENVFARVRKPVARQRTRIFSRRELVCYLRECRPDYRRFLMAMRGTLARPQEIRALTWPMLTVPIDWPGTLEEALHAGVAMFVLWSDFKSREMMADPNKPRIIVVGRRVGRMLLRMRSKAASLDGPVFLNSQAKAWTANAVRCRMRRLRVKFPKPAHTGENIVTYSMRHTAATYASPKVSQSELAQVLNHRSVRTTERYQHLQPEHLLATMEKIEDRAGIQARRKKRLEEAAKKKGG